jgi:hypothetical protein
VHTPACEGGGAGTTRLGVLQEPNKGVRGVTPPLPPPPTQLSSPPPLPPIPPKAPPPPKKKRAPAPQSHSHRPPKRAPAPRQPQSHSLSTHRVGRRYQGRGRAPTPGACPPAEGRGLGGQARGPRRAQRPPGHGAPGPPRCPPPPPPCPRRWRCRWRCPRWRGGGGPGPCHWVPEEDRCMGEGGLVSVDINTNNEGVRPLWQHAH